MREVWVVIGVVCPYGEGSSILQGVCHDLLKTRPSPLFMLGGNLISGTSPMIEPMCWNLVENSFVILELL
jgi:hypothetical protein